MSHQISHWNHEDVRLWLSANSLGHFSEPFARNGVDGKKLLNLTESEIESILVYKEIEHLKMCIKHLKNATLVDSYGLAINGNGLASKPCHKNGSLVSSNHVNSTSDHVCISLPVFQDEADQEDYYPRECWKTLIAFVYFALSLFTTTMVLSALVHERVPSKDIDPPLPDIFFDFVPRIPYAFDVVEWAGIINVSIVFTLLFFHRHKFIVFRRLFFITGSLYFLRCITMYVTTLPVPGQHFKCAPKVHTWSAKVSRAIHLLMGGGMSLTNSHHLCGDFLFSGHTVVLVLSFLFIQQYTPKSFYLLRYMAWIMSFIGLCGILAAHEHYSIDVVVAYYVTTRTFWSYHTVANFQCLKVKSESNLLSNEISFGIVAFFERNVNGILPNEFKCPVIIPKWLWNLVLGVKFSD